MTELEQAEAHYTYWRQRKVGPYRTGWCHSDDLNFQDARDHYYALLRKHNEQTRPEQLQP